MSKEFTLTDVQARVLGCLVEKAVTTPDQYPLTLNSTKVACNQKSNREPVVTYDENQVRQALLQLENIKLVRQLSPHDSRVAKYEHHAGKVFDITAKELAILTVLLLRGPQTIGELRTRTQRYCDFADLNEVERIISRLESKEPKPFIQMLERMPGQKECRYIQNLTDYDADMFGAAQSATSVTFNPSDGSTADLKQEITILKEELNKLKERVELLEG